MRERTVRGLSAEAIFETSNVGFAVSCAIDVVIVVAALWRPTVLRVLGALALLAIKGVVMIALGLEIPFGVAHVVWLDLAIVLPLAGFVAFAVTRHGVFLLALLAVPIAAYASFIEPERLVTERATVRVAPERAGDAEVRIAVLSDLQFEHVGQHEREAVDRVLRERPDAIVIPGDLHQGSPESLKEELPAIRALLRRLRAPLGVFAVEGDSEDPPKLRVELEGTGVVALVNQVAELRKADRRITLLGVERAFELGKARDAIGGLEVAPGRDVRILLAHTPDVVEAVADDSRIDLVIAGHTHGGQIQLPWIGPLFTASRIPRDIAAGGLHEVRGTPLYVSRGVGVERNQAPKLRFGSVPEISILTIR